MKEKTYRALLDNEKELLHNFHGGVILYGTKKKAMDWAGELRKPVKIKLIVMEIKYGKN